MMDAISERASEVVVIKSCSQVGKTEIINNTVGYFIDQDPSPILLIQPTLELAQAWSKDRFAPMIRDTPALTGKVSDVRGRDTVNTILHKNFPGGQITMAGANSPASLASRPVRVLLCDEVDRYPISAGTEGDPINLAKKRTATFFNRLILLFSTPTIDGASRIDDVYQQSDKRQYFVPCPHCGHMQTLKWSGIKWDDGQPDSARYICEDCGSEIAESSKHRMLASGEWRAENPLSKIAGFHLNELYSPWRKWREVVEDFLEAKGDSEKLKTWTNTALGETFRLKKTEDLNHSDLYKRREHYKAAVPPGVLLLTAGVDCQKDRFEIEITGWGLDEESWLIRYVRLYGDMDSPVTWAALADVLRMQYLNADNATFKPMLACIDSGYKPDNVYKFCAKNGPLWLIPTKGASTPGTPVVRFPKRPNDQGVYLTMIGTDTAKHTCFDRFGILEPGPGYCHFPVSDETDEAYFKQLTVEKRQPKYRKGQLYFEWVKSDGARNEAFDCRILSFSALRLLQQHGGVNLKQLHEIRAQTPALSAPAAQEEIEKKPMSNRRRIISKGIKL